MCLTGLVERLRFSGARLTWVKPDAMHLTLRFLGEVDAEPLGRFGKLLSEGYEGLSPFELRICGTGAFPNGRRPSVLWVGVEPSAGPLTRVQEVAERAAREIGLAAEDRAFHPHLTVARVKDPREGAKALPYWEREQGFEAGAFAVDGVTLFSSRLTPRSRSCSSLISSILRPITPRGPTGATGRSPGISGFIWPFTTPISD